MIRKLQALVLSAIVMAVPASAEMKLSGKLMVVGGQLLAAQEICGFDVNIAKLVGIVRYNLEAMVPGISGEDFVFFLEGQSLSTVSDYRKMSPKRKFRFCGALKTNAKVFGVLNEG